MSKYQVIALVGKAGAGKDTIQRATCTAHPLMFNPIVSCTTRPMREKEVQGVDYHFTSLEDFTRNVLNGTMLEATEFRGWFYGTPESSLAKDKINIGVFNPAGVEALLEDPRLDVFVIEVLVNDKTRLLRCLNRENKPDCTEVCRRFLTDEKDFAVLSEWEEFAVVGNEDGEDPDLLRKLEHRLEWFETMWNELGVDTAFETIMRWESSMSKKADPANDEVSNG